MLTGPDALKRDLLIEYLHRLNDHFHALYKRHLVALASRMGLSMAEVYEVATFYHHFKVLEDDQTAPKHVLRVCDGLSCQLSGAGELVSGLKASCEQHGVHLEAAPCVGRCEQAPVAVLDQRPFPRANLQTLFSALQAAGTATSMHPPSEAAEAEKAFTPAAFSEQPITSYPTDAGPIEVSPAVVSLQTYRNAGGYVLPQQLSQGLVDPESVIKALEDSGLRGLGGAGFPAGRKWRIVRDQAAPKLMAVNIDEGEPGTFKDRTYLERDPHRFLEGLLVAAQVVGVASVYIYLRDEYHGCRAVLAQAIEELQAMPPQYSSMSSCSVMPAGASFTPGDLTRPLTLKLRRPFRP